MATSTAGSPAVHKKPRKPTTTWGGLTGEVATVALTEAGTICAAATLLVLGTSLQHFKACLACRTSGFRIHPGHHKGW